ncbi:MAG TPA: nucleoside-diphosphate sugar epimerase/dehydratase, partial [Aggregicoccus sp.]|nr:nucleoside-diphosphate sugar epimerase/dehydratase [Aggregicoccus sp.]
MLESSWVSSPSRLQLAPWLRSATMLLLDATLTLGSLVCSVLVRFEGRPPPLWLAALEQGVPLLLAMRLLTLGGMGLHRWSFHGSGLPEAGRLALANAVASLLFLASQSLLSLPRWPESVVATEFFLTTALLTGFRFTPRLLWMWRMDRQRARDQGKQRTLIVGAGNAGELLLHDLLHSSHGCFHVVGLVDDDPVKHGTQLSGKPVLGPISALPELVERHRVSGVLIAIPLLAPERIRYILDLCMQQNVSFKIMPASLADMDERITASMLHDLSPEDLLPRRAVAFDPHEVHRLVTGRRVLITGAAGSIGSELARQVAAHEPASLVLVDMNENELYFLARLLEERHPQLALSAIVADIRDAERLLRLGREHAPQDVFHAAAHKHVPLMESTPEEAIKNNVFGTLHVARMADACGAERFVLISTDKAVHPSSIMGASKRLAELVIRDVAARSRTRFTAGRFGNVLGSAGSVVPLFKQQIKRGGPVTVTHPDCTRYFMTIPEAVGLVLLAGLGGYGELCLLDMGAPVRIAELATNMISMAGLVPGKDIPIVYTGLRPGEKLVETLMSEEEESTQQVRDRIKVAHSPPPPADLRRRLEQLRQCALAGDAGGIQELLRSLIPTYAPPAGERALPALPAAARAEELRRPAPAPGREEAPGG